MKKYNTKTFARALITTLCFLTMRPMEGYAAVSAATASLEEKKPSALFNIQPAVLLHIHEYSTPEDVKELAKTCKALLWNSAEASVPLYAAALRNGNATPQVINFAIKFYKDTEQQGGLINLIVHYLFPPANPVLALNRTMPAFLQPYVQEVSVSHEAIANFAGAHNMRPATVGWALNTLESHWVRANGEVPTLSVPENIQGYVTLADARGMNPDILQSKTHLLVKSVDVEDVEDTAKRNTIENILQYSSH